MPRAKGNKNKATDKVKKAVSKPVAPARTKPANALPGAVPDTPIKKKFELFGQEEKDAVAAEQAKVEVAKGGEVVLSDQTVAVVPHTVKIEKSMSEITDIKPAPPTPSIFSFIRGDGRPKSVHHIAAELLGVVGQAQFERKMVKLSKTEFQFHSHGVMLRFIKDNPGDKNNQRWIVVSGQDTRRICVPAAYWLIDVLTAETNGKLFYSPGREGIRR